VIDRVATSVEGRARLFDAIENRSATSGERASQILKLIAAQCLTEPRLATRARTILLSTIGKPGFLASYVAVSESREPNAAFADLMKLLETAGIPPEKSMKAIAA
jgi:hypothetical protein